MQILRLTLETLRDVMYVIPNIGDESLKLNKYGEFRDYVDKIIVDKKFTARYMQNSGV